MGDRPSMSLLKELSVQARARCYKYFVPPGLRQSSMLTQFLGRSPKEDQYDVLLAFEEWLKSQ